MDHQLLWIKGGGRAKTRLVKISGRVQARDKVYREDGRRWSHTCDPSYAGGRDQKD
jgi:hypothetical protein